MKFMILYFAILFLCIFAMRVSAQGTARNTIELNLDFNSAGVLDKGVSYIKISNISEYIIAANRTLSINFSVYRGSNLKRTVYAWIAGEDGKAVSAKAKFSLPARFKSYNLSANLSFSKCNEEGFYLIIVEGFDINSSKKVFIDFIGCNATDAEGDAVIESQQKGEVSFDVFDYVNETASGELFRTRLIVRNPTAADLEISSWSYVYKGSKCYSGDRQENLKNLNLSGFSNITFDLENRVQAEPGNYTMKFSFLRSDRKTPYEIKLPFRVVEKEKKQSSDFSSLQDAASLEILKNQNKESKKDSTPKKKFLQESNDSDTNSSGVVYRSSSAKARSITIYLLLFLLLIILVALILKKL